MKAYNICPDKEIVEQKQNQTTMLTDNTMTKGLQDTSTVSKSELEDSRTIDIEDGQATGAAFWHRPAKRLKEQDSTKTTCFLKQDIADITNRKQHLVLPQNLATLAKGKTAKELTENDMRKQVMSQFIGYVSDYFTPDEQSEFDYNQYVSFLKKREMPILPQFKSAPLAYKYVAQYTKNVIRVQYYSYNIVENTIRLVKFNDSRGIFTLQQMFEKSSGYVHFFITYAPAAETQARLNYSMTQRINFLIRELLATKKPLQATQKPILMFQADSQATSTDQQALINQKTSVLQVSDEYV